MTISAKVIAASLSPAATPLITVEARYPRFIHAELMTHRVFSRNASSSRAIPVERLIKDILDDTAMPLHWGKNQPGMRAREPHTAEVDLSRASIHDGRCSSSTAWLSARDEAVFHARAFAAAGYHKQIVNRLLEPFSHIKVVITATEWGNFFALRCHPDAQPEMQGLAHAIKAVVMRAQCTPLKPGEWHLPYVDEDDRADAETAPPDVRTLHLIKLSAARCARTSYLTHEGHKPSPLEDHRLYDRLVAETPPHASPLEHQATPDDWVIRSYGVGEWANEEEHGNFVGWRQHRKMMGW